MFSLIYIQVSASSLVKMQVLDIFWIIHDIENNFLRRVESESCSTSRPIVVCLVHSSKIFYLAVNDFHKYNIDGNRA